MIQELFNKCTIGVELLILIWLILLEIRLNRRLKKTITKGLD